MKNKDQQAFMHLKLEEEKTWLRGLKSQSCQMIVQAMNRFRSHWQGRQS